MRSREVAVPYEAYCSDIELNYLLCYLLRALHFTHLSPVLLFLCVDDDDSVAVV